MREIGQNRSIADIAVQRLRLHARQRDHQAFAPAIDRLVVHRRLKAELIGVQHVEREQEADIEREDRNRRAGRRRSRRYGRFWVGMSTAGDLVSGRSATVTSTSSRRRADAPLCRALAIGYCTICRSR